MSRSLRLSLDGKQQVERSLTTLAWNNEKLMEAAGVQIATVKKFRSGKQVCRKNFVNFCKALGIPWESVVDFEADSSVGSKHQPSMIGQGHIASIEVNREFLVSHNLPPQTNKFIGRESELKRLNEILSESHSAHIITIDGIGGVGKTALILEAAYRCLANKKYINDIPNFDAIIFTSAKESYLLPTGVTPRSKFIAETNLRDIYRAISLTLENPSITQATPEEQLEHVQRCLLNRKVLLIVDNLETLENKDSVIGFLSEMMTSVSVSLHNQL